MGRAAVAVRWHQLRKALQLMVVAVVWWRNFSNGALEWYQHRDTKDDFAVSQRRVYVTWHTIRVFNLCKKDIHRVEVVLTANQAFKPTPYVEIVSILVWTKNLTQIIRQGNYYGCGM